MRDVFAERFRQARRHAKLSQDDIAAVCRNRSGDQLSRAAIAQWEKPGGARPNFYNLVAAARRIGASIDWLVGLTEVESASYGSESLLLRKYKNADPRDKQIIRQLLDMDPMLKVADDEEVAKHIRPAHHSRRDK